MRGLCGCLTALLVATSWTPASAQSRTTDNSSEGAQRQQAPAPSDASLDRLRRALTLQDDSGPQTSDLDFREVFPLDDRRPRTELIPGVDVLGGVDQFRRVGAPTPGSLPGHWDMMDVMSPREVKEMGSTDVLGIGTASAVAAALMFAPAAFKTIGGWLFGPSPEEAGTDPILTGGEETLALASMTAVPRVVEADIDQRERTVVLSLVVPPNTPAETAHALGERFVRLVKTIASAEPPPGDEIGPGSFDYVVHISAPTQIAIARGGKPMADHTLSW